VNEHLLRSPYELDDPDHQSAIIAAGLSWNLYDCRAGYNAVIIEGDSRKYLMFVIYGLNGKPCYLIPTRMTTGMPNCVECYSWIISRAFAKIPNTATDIDDISQADRPDFQCNIANMEKVFLCARTHNITFNLSKLELFQKRVKILGNVVTAEGIQPDPTRIGALKDFKFLSRIRVFNRLLGYTILLRSLCLGQLPNVHVY